VKIFNDPSDGVSRKKFRGGPGISGFSLIEIALALGIIAFAALTASADGWATIPATMSFKTLRFYVVR
jgi:hypothetical protein